MQYERVYTIWGFYDGARTGIADFNGVPHYFACLFNEVADDYSDNFRLYPVGIEFIERAIRTDEIYRVWENKFQSGEVGIETHPGHGEIDAEYDEIKSWLDNEIAGLRAIPSLYGAEFRVLPDQESILPRIIRNQEVKWSPLPGQL